MDETHLRPIGDAIEHPMDRDCICGPTVEELHNGTIVIHHSLDGREHEEQTDA